MSDNLDRSFDNLSSIPSTPEKSYKSARDIPYKRKTRIKPSSQSLPSTTRDITDNYSKYLSSAVTDGTSTPYGFLKRSKSEDCLKCMLKIPHQKCEAHKYIRIGGGYRHSYLYCKAMLEEIELQRQREALLQKRLEAIQEGQPKAIKTYIRTKSGKLKERIIFLNEDDYQAFQRGGQDALEALRRHLTQAEADNIESYEKEEQKAITTYIRTKSGRRIAKTVYISKDEYNAIKEGRVDANAILKKHVKPGKGETVEGWDDAQMKAVKTLVRTKSGRLKEKTIMVSKEDYDKLQELKKQGKDAGDLLGKYMSVEDGEKIEGWKKQESSSMKTVKAMIRTKSGRLIQKTILMTEDEYNEFQEGGGKLEDLKKYMKLKPDDQIDNWEKASTVYSASDDEAVDNGIPGSRIVGKDGKVYEIVVDEVTGKKYKKRLDKKESDVDSGFDSMKTLKGKIGKGAIIGAVEEDPNEAKMSKEEKAAYREGKRRDDSDSDFSYRSTHSAGGTRHVQRMRKREDGTYSDPESYHSDQDEAGKARRQDRRKTRKVKAIKEKKEKLVKGKRDVDSDGSEFSYRSVKSAGGTRKVMRRKKKADGTYSAEEEYHSSQDEDGEKRRKSRRKKRTEAVKKGKRNKGSDSEYSYASEHSVGGTRKVRRRRKKADGTYSDAESYDSEKDAAGMARRRKRRQERQKKYKGGKRREESDSDYSYRSVVSAGGTRKVKRRKKRADGTYSDEESYHSSQDEGGDARRRRRRRDRKHAGSAHSYYSVVSEGGTRKVKRKKKNKDGTYGDSESYHSGDSDFFKRDSDSEYEMKPDGKGGYKKVKKTKKKGDKKRKGGGPDGNMTDFSDDLQSTDSEDEPDLTKMSKTEKAKYIKEKAKRKAEREKKRKEKYGEKYEEMVQKHEKAKKAKSMVTYGKGSARFKDGEVDERGIGLGHDSWSRRKQRTYVDGHEADDESDDEEVDYFETDKDGNIKLKKGTKKINIDKLSDEDLKKLGIDPTKMTKEEIKKKLQEKFGDAVEIVEKKKKKKKDAEDDEESLYEYARDEHGNVLRDKDGNMIKKKIGTVKKGKRGKGKGVVDSDSDFEYSYDKEGNLVRKKKNESDPELDDGDYFETMPDGTIKLKRGKKKIDINKLSKEDLEKLGITEDMSKQEIARILKEKFGDEVKITKGRGKVGLKNIADYGGADTDELAYDSDLDTSTLTGHRKIRLMMKRGGKGILEHMKKVVDESALTDEQHAQPEEKENDIDFLKHYRLVDPGKIESYAKAFVCEDEDKSFRIPAKNARAALEGVPSVQDIDKKQMDYVIKLLDIDDNSKLTFRMFAVMTALAERVTAMDSYSRHLLEIANLTDIERKMELYKMMFYCNNTGDRDPNFIKLESLRIELIAGGLKWDQQDYVLEKMQPNDWREISFIDYLCYIPLFMSMHDKMCANPLDMSDNKYTRNRPASVQRDMNPLGYPIKKNTAFMQRNNRAKELQQKANNLLAGKKVEEIKNEGMELYSKYKKLPHISSSTTGSKNSSLSLRRKSTKVSK